MAVALLNLHTLHVFQGAFSCGDNEARTVVYDDIFNCMSRCFGETAFDTDSKDFGMWSAAVNTPRTIQFGVKHSVSETCNLEGVHAYKRGGGEKISRGRASSAAASA